MEKDKTEITLEEILATPVPALINGKTHLMYPLTIAQTSELDTWIRSEFIQSIHDAINIGNFNEKERKELLETAILAAYGTTFFVLKNDFRLQDPVFATEYTIRLAHQHFLKDLNLPLEEFRKLFYENLEENCNEFFKAFKLFANSFAKWEPEVAAETILKQKDETTKRAFDFLMAKGWALSDLENLTLAQVVYAAEAAAGQSHVNVEKDHFNGNPQDLAKWIEERRKEKDE